jgi:histidinol dehydrogenase
LVGSLEDAEALAPEHLVLLGAEAEALAPQVRNAGAVFVGESSPVAAGDYATGGNHVLPTGGWARSLGGLGLETFLKPVTIQRLTPEGLARVRPVVEALAAVEGMPAHAEAVRR